MAKTTLNLRVDEDVKNRAENILSQLGISMTAAVVLYLKAISREKAIPFSLKVDSVSEGIKKTKTTKSSKKTKKTVKKVSAPKNEEESDDLYDLPGSSSLLDAITKI